MKRIHLFVSLIYAAALGSTSTVLAEGLPTSQPKLLTIMREEVKVGRSAAHAKHEAGWPAAFAKAKSPDYYIAITSITGPNEAWYLLPWESNAAEGESMKRDDKNSVLSAELERLSLGDAEYINSTRTLKARAHPELSVGSFPDISKVRFFEMTWFRVHPGREMQFEEAAKAYATARTRADTKMGYRVYQMTAGMQTPAYLVIASVEDYGDFDKVSEADMATWKAATADEMAALQKAGGEAITSIESNLFKVDPKQSYVPKETREKDPDFWLPK